MTNELALIHDLGEDVDLLLRPEAYLDNQLNDIASRMHLLAQEYKTTSAAKKCKRILQDQNKVAVRILNKSTDGMITDIVIKIMPLKEALNKLLEAKDDPTAELQIHTLANEGYDLDFYFDKREEK